MFNIGNHDEKSPAVRYFNTPNQDALWMLRLFKLRAINVSF